MFQSSALEANIASHHIEVEPDPKYDPIREVMSRFYGLREGVMTFVKELSHPQKNLPFITGEARGYALNYFHLIKEHEKGPEAADLFVDIFICVARTAAVPQVRTDAVDNLLLFLLKIIRETRTSTLPHFLPVLKNAFRRMERFDDDTFFLFVQSYYRPERLARELADCGEAALSDAEDLIRLLLKYYQFTYDCWLGEKDPLPWFEKEAEIRGHQEILEEIFDGITHRQIEALQLQLKADAQAWRGEKPDTDGKARLQYLLEYPGYTDIVEIYRAAPRKLLNAPEQKSTGNLWKVIFMFHIMNLSGLSLIHEETLRDINRTLAWLISHEKHVNIEKHITKTFSILKKQTRLFPATALSCVLNMGRGVYKTDDSDLVKLFINQVTELGFHAPMIGGVSNDWQIRVNPSHILNIRTWLSLIELNPKWSTRLLSELIIHLSLRGVFIKDTDLFPRDITRLLNCDIGPVYNLIKQLARLFPVYFNDIGAEGELRDISTEIDEITHRKDHLVHFLRKQIHVESSSRVIPFMEAAFHFWLTGNKEPVKPYIPPNIYDQVKSEGPYAEGLRALLLHLKEDRGFSIPEHFLAVSPNELREHLADSEAAPERDRERLILAAHLFRLLHQKYNLTMNLEACGEMACYLSQLRIEAFPDLNKLRDALNETDTLKKLDRLLTYMEMLKELILSPQTYEIKEDIYKKRHFTVDIPSMYGSYHEMKFDALGLAFRIESVVNVCFESTVENLDLNMITRETFKLIFKVLKLFNRSLKLDGISSVEMENQLELLDHALITRGFTFTQYRDIFRGFTRAVSNITNDYFSNIHGHNMIRILQRIPAEEIKERYIAGDSIDDPEKYRLKISEIFIREKIASSLGLRQFDLFLMRIIKTLSDQEHLIPQNKLRRLLNYDPQRAMVAIGDLESRINGIIDLGNKGYNLVNLNRLGFPVPPGFIITTEVFRCHDVIEAYPPAQQNLNEQVASHIRKLEAKTGKRFGVPSNPLIFSVRSGASISQPGMMDTYLDVGMNEEIAAGIAEKTGNEWFAWDNYRRFIQCWGMGEGLQRNDFDAIMFKYKAEKGISVKRSFTGKEMRNLALAYRDLVRKRGIHVPDNPFDQVMETIKNVLKSWDSEKAKAYRNIMHISDDWGTAVTVQAMIYGNMSDSSGTGVVFTHNPKWSEDNIRLWGDFTIGNQGEDVVSGLVTTLPVSITQQENEMRDTDTTLQTHFPLIYKALHEWISELIYTQGWSPQEIEFTFESPDPKDLYLLQSRNMAIRESRQVFTFDPAEAADARAYLGNGIGVSGGAMSGRAVFSIEEINTWRYREPGTPLILIRGDTVPDDIIEINASDGLLTARGGVTSHASVVAHRLGKTCVVGCGNLFCFEKDRKAVFENVDAVARSVDIFSGDYISIDGQEGRIYRGRLSLNEPPLHSFREERK